MSAWRMSDHQIPLRSVLWSTEQNAVALHVLDSVLSRSKTATGVGAIVGDAANSVCFWIALSEKANGSPAVEDVPHVTLVMQTGSLGRQEIARPSVPASRRKGIANCAGKLARNKDTFHGMR